MKYKYKEKSNRIVKNQYHCRNKCLLEIFYVKHDGTRCYYFNMEDIERLFGSGKKMKTKMEKKNDTTDDNAVGDKGEDRDDGDDKEGAGLEILEIKYAQRVYERFHAHGVVWAIWLLGKPENNLVFNHHLLRAIESFGGRNAIFCCCGI